MTPVTGEVEPDDRDVIGVAAVAGGLPAGSERDVHDAPYLPSDPNATDIRRLSSAHPVWSAITGVANVVVIYALVEHGSRGSLVN